MQPENAARRSLRLFSILVRRHPGYVFITIVLLLLSSTFEGIGIAMLLPLLDAITGSGASNSPIVSWITGALEGLGLEPTLETLITLVVSLVIIKAAFSLVTQSFIGVVFADIGADFRHRIVASMMQARWQHFVSLPNGRVASAISSEVNVAASCYVAIIKLIASTIQVAVQLGVACLISWKVALLGCLLGGAIALLSSRLVSLSRVLGEKRTRGMEGLSRRLLEAIGGMKALKGMGAEDRFVALLNWEIGSIKSVTRNLFFLTNAMQVIPEPIAAIVVGVSLYVYMLHMGGGLESFLVLALLLSRLMQSVSSVQQNYQKIVSREPSFWFVENIISDAEGWIERSKGTRPPSLEKAIRFDKVSLSYGNHSVLSDVDLNIEAGKICAFAGLSGAGKTSLVDLVAGLHEPEAGTIYVDDVPLQEIDMKQWRSRLGYVLQETFLFHETIKNNVTLGDPLLTSEDAEAALRKAGAWQFVSQLPERMETVVGERGARLSGGQRQRIAIARALVRQPSLLILDEPTVGLDRQTEREICTTLANLGQGVTVLAVSHQPALFEVADTIYQVRDGHVSTVAHPNVAVAATDPLADLEPQAQGRPVA